MRSFLMHPFSRSFLAVILAVSIIAPFSSLARSIKTGDEPTATQSQIQEKYTSATATGKKVRILIVPGHEPGFGGTVYKNVYERDITVQVANELETYLNQNPRLEVIVSRSDTAWNDDLQNYFENSWKEIQKFVTKKKSQMAKSIKKGSVLVRSVDEQVDHASAPDDVALRLYGINAWASENNVDLVLHLHINDTADHGSDAPSAHSGYAVYVPDSQFNNASTSRALGASIAYELSRLSATSTLPIENKGVVEDQDLIAIGANGTLSVPTALVEYGYVSEPKLAQPDVRAIVAKDYAYMTYKGIQSFLGVPTASRFISSALPATFSTSSTVAMGSSSPSVYALQATLHSLGYYPLQASSTPANVRLMAPSLATCPIDGVMSACVTNGIEAFQIAHGWGTTGRLGPLTRAALNKVFATY